MISPEGFAISPLIPASCRIWSLLPLAPESAIMKIGLKLFALTFWPLRPDTSSTAISAIISEAIVSVDWAQMSTTLLYFSPSVIRPLLYWSSILFTSRSAFSMISALREGMVMSFMEMEMPDRVAYR